MNPCKKISTAREYEQMLSHLCYLVDFALTKMENISKKGEENEFYEVIDEIPKILCLIKSLGYLRGSEGSLSSVLKDLRAKYRPFGDFVHIEDEFEVRLESLLEKIRSNPKSLHFFEKKLDDIMINIQHA